MKLIEMGPIDRDQLLSMARANGFRGFENYPDSEALAPSSVEIWQRRMLAFAWAVLTNERFGATD